MSNLPIFDIAGSALQAQSVRMSTIASNLSNADTVAGSADAVYKPLEPIFQAVTSKNDPNITSVKVKEITQSEAAPIKRYEPGHPLADADGNKMLAVDVFRPRERYVRLVIDRATANAVIDGVIAIQYGARKMPTTHATSVAASESHTSPAEGTA